MSHLSRLPLVSILALAMLASGCGGGGEDPPARPSAAKPQASAGEDQAVNEGVPVTLSGAASRDRDGSIEEYRWEQTAGRPVQLGGAATDTATFTAPATTVALTLTFRLTVTDNGGNTDTDQVQVAVSPVNVAPVAQDDSAETAEDTPVAISVLANDTDEDDAAAADDAAELDPASVAVTGLTGGTATVADGVVRFQPAPNFNGAASFQYTVADRHGAVSNPATVAIAVLAVNDAPGISDIGDQTIDEDTVAGPIAFTVGDIDSDASTLVVTASSDNEALVPASAITLGGDGADRTIVLTPVANGNGVANITVTVSDGDAAVGDVFALTVNAVNDAPVATAGSASGDEDRGAITGTLAATDIDSTGLTFRSDSSPAHGSVTVSAEGAFAYTPVVNFAGSDSFTFVASDGALDSDPATVSITVNEQGEAVLTVSDAAPVAEDDGALEFTVSLSRAPDGPVAIAYVSSDGAARAGQDYDAASGVLEFGPGGPVSQVVTVPVIDDSADENDEGLTLGFAVSVGGDSVEETGTLVASGLIHDNDDSDLLQVGAAKRSVKPSQAHIDGVPEARLGGTERTQKFNLGGFGINPTQSLPNPADQLGEALTTPAEIAAFSGSRGEEPIHIRVMIVEEKDGDRLAFVMLDAIGAGNLIQDGVKAAVQDAIGIEPKNILFGQTHSHAGPDLQGLWGGVPEDWIQNTLYQAAGEAAAEALAARRPARLSLAQGQTVEFNNYRRPRIDPNADADGTLTLLKAVGDDGTPVGSILQYNAHPTSINESKRAVHADYIQGAMDWIEAENGGVGLYYNGPIADASGSGERTGCEKAPQDGNYGNVRCRGEGIADQALQYAERELAPTLVIAEKNVILPITNPGFLAFGAVGSFNRYYDFLMLPTADIPGIGPETRNLPQLTPAAQTLVSRITIGGAETGLEVVTIPGEATNTFGQYIRSLAKTNVMLLGLTHNSFGYIIPEEEFSYVDQEGDDGLVAPFTGYEENVSLGPLTAPLLRTEGYNPLFGAAAPEKDIPPTLSSCVDAPQSATCVVTVVNNRLDVLMAGIEACVEGGIGAPGCPLDTTWGFFEDSLETIADGCRDFGGPEAFCALFDTAPPGVGSSADDNLMLAAVEAQLKGCDFLDPAHCLFPFPNDHFTVEAVEGTPQAKNPANPELGGTGRRVNLNPLAMPRNIAGKPVDPTEWNRNDGFSPGNMLITFVPDLAVDANGSVTGAVPLMDVARSRDADAPIFVIDADTGERHLVWAEIDLNANLLLHGAAPEVETGEEVERPLQDGRAALIIRPAKNFVEGHRYIVALRNLKGANGQRLKPGIGFQVCRGDVPSTLREQAPAIRDRCDHIEELISTLDSHESDFDPAELYLTWDFTVASAKNNVGRLAHMRDAAFNSLGAAPGADCTQHADGAPCAAPSFTVEKITDNPQEGIARRIEGSITVPSFVVPVEPTPGDNPPTNTAASAADAAWRQVCAGIPSLPDDAPEEFHDGWSEIRGACGDAVETAGIGQGATLPPNRLFYNPADALVTDPSQAPYGDGLPDSVGTMQTRFICQIPQKALTEGPARAGIYGHGLLDSRVAITYDGVPQLSREYNYMFCAVDLFGFASGDLGNVASQLADVSNFPVVPDGSQQGLLNYMFLARLIAHPQGFAADAAFQGEGGAPLFDRREVFYDGNSQGGIVGGAVMAISKDVNRGVLGSLGMNYSTLLQRSKDFDPFSTPLYAAYPDPLDRMFLYSLIQMLWDRSENNGYAAHLTQKSAVEGGPVDAVLLNPMYGDQQVTMWSADVMARTMGIPADYAMVGRAGKTHPDVVPGWPLPSVAYGIEENGARFADVSSAQVMWADTRTAEPVPTGNVPHRAGRDPHDDSAKKAAGRCVKAHFLHRNGRLLDVNTEAFQPETSDHAVACPAQQDNGGAPGAGTPGTPGIAGALGSFLSALGDAVAALVGGDPQGAISAVVAGADALAEAVLGGDAPLAPPAATDRLYAGAAEGPTRIPVGTPLGGYLRPPVGGDWGAALVEGSEDLQSDGEDAFEQGTPEPFLEGVQEFLSVVMGPSADEFLDFINGGTDHDGVPLAPVPDEARVAHSPYATISPPTRGYYDSLVTKAVALRNGDKTVVLVKLDMIGMIDEVVVDVAERVKQRTGVDLSNGGLMMSGTHTHDGPGALANNALKFFWVAMDLYQHEVYLRVVDDIAGTVIAALSDMKPARFGYAVGVDTSNSNKYRRGQDLHDQSKNAERDYVRKRIGVLRVDDADGNPLAAIVNYSAHGIAFDVENQYFSGDVMGSVEREFSYTFDRPVVVLSVQSAGGDVSPEVWRNPSKLQGIERFGKRLAPVIRSVYDSVANFDDAPVLKSVSQRIVLNPETLGYADNEYPYPWGAIECNAAPVPDGCLVMPPPDADDLADNGVAENKAWGPGDTRLTSIRIGDAVLIGQPGETLTEFGRQILERSPFGRDNTFIWGTSQDHIGYLLADNKADWQRGGTEGTTTFWGWKLATRLHRGYDELNQVLLGDLQPGEPGYPSDEFAIRYTHDQIPATPARTLPSLRPGRVITQPSAIARFEATTFSWEGGDPVVDFPEVEMQRLDGGQWDVVRRANGTPLNTYFEMHLEYQLATGAHQWMVHFEAPKDWTPGTYRFAVRGTAAIGPVATAAEALRQPYEVVSDGFAVTPAGTLTFSAPAVEGPRVRVAMSYEPKPGNYRIIDIDTDPRNAAPVRGGTVTFANATHTVTDDDRNGDGVYEAAITGAVTITGQDTYGNTAVPVTTGGTPPPDQDGDGVPDAADQCPTEAGPASNNGCPEGGEEPPPFPVTLCEPVSGENYCLDDVPVIGEPLEQALLAVWAAVNGGGEPPNTSDAEQVAADAARNAGTLPADLLASAGQTAANAADGALADRDAEAVVLEGRSLPDWSQPAAVGLANPYPSGVGGDGDFVTGGTPFYVRDAHNGTMLYPPPGVPFEGLPNAAPVGEIVAFRRQDDRWVEIPVQVDERFPYFLANAHSGFSFYSGTDMELTYAWDRETWKATGECEVDEASVAPMADPVPGLDDDDEIVFMAGDAGDPVAATAPAPEGTVGAGQEIALSDPLNPGLPKFVYLYRRPGGPSFARGHYVSYERDANADQFVDRGFWDERDPERLGTSLTGYGPNVAGIVCPEGASPRNSNDRFPRDGVTISTDRYRLHASGRWMVRDVHIAKPDRPGVYGADIVDRWKGRAFQQSPGTLDIVGFEDEQSNWEANSALLGERAGPVRAIREIWGADSGTNVTKTETYYRDAYSYRYRVRVHPIPPDGLYTSWDYNRSAMVPAEGEDVPGGRYYTAVRGTGVPIDGVNDDIGQVDRVQPVDGMCITVDGPRPASEYGGTCPVFFDAGDPMLNLPLTMYNWEQVAAKGDLGSLVYLFELKSPTIGANAVAVPYYRDDACLDDATGDDPVPRPYPGEPPTDPRVIAGYEAANGGTPYAQLRCDQRQGAHAQHGVHFLAPPESDNAMMPVPVNEIDGQQWAFAVPMQEPANVGERYANIVRAPLQKIVRPRPAASDVAGDSVPTDYATCVAMARQGGDAQQEAAAKFTCAVIFGGGRTEGEGAADEIQGPNTYVAMDDGTLIATNVYIPWACNVAKNPNARRCPSILEMSGYESGSDEGRTPSGDLDDILGNPGLPLTGGTRASHDKFYKSGDRYVSVVASVRGTGCSAGEFDVFSRKSAMDGYQLVEWMADQPWSNGKVGIFGHSYSGITGAMIASTNPPSLKMVSISGQIGDIYRDIVYPGGVSNYGFPLLWTGGVRPAYDYLGGTFAGLIADSQDRQCLRNQAARSRTVEDEPLISGLSDVDGPWYQERSVVNDLKNVTAPTQVVTAYQDEQTGPRGGTHVFDYLPQNLTRRLVILNGDHGSQTGPAEVVAERRFWIDRFMLGPDDPAPRPWSPGTSLPAPVIADDGTATSRVLLEVNGGAKSNGHVDSAGFPLSQTRWTDLYFHVDGALDAAKSTLLHGEPGSGSTYLSGSKRQAYSYQANSNTIDDNDAALSTADADGTDELVFALDIDTVAQAYGTSGHKAFVIAGPVTADLWLTSTAPDTELMVQLIDADPATGERLYLQRGVLRASHRDILAEASQCAAFPEGGRITHRACTDLDNIYRPFRKHVNPRDIVPLQVTRYRLEIFPVGHVFRAGHQLLVKIHAPSLDDNDWAYIPKTAPALNTLHHSADYPSSLRLPVIPVADVQRLGGPTATCSDDSMRCTYTEPLRDFTEGCRQLGAQYDASGGVFTDLICGAIEAIRDAFPAGGDGEPSASDVGQQTGPALDQAAGAVQDAIGSAEGSGRVLAGVGVADMTPDVGYGAGQYSSENAAIIDGAAGGDMDPYATGKKQTKSYGVMTRLTARAIVVEGSNGKRIALLKSDNYLAQDNLLRRVGQILAEHGSGVGYDQILYHVTHAHSTPYNATLSAGVFAFQDAYDARFFEFQARRLAEAILEAEANLAPARMGATTVRHKIFKGNIMGPATGDDGTPVQYPTEYGDHGLVVMRFETDEAAPQPIAAWVNWGEHPEGLDGMDLHSADFVAFLERFVDRELGVPLVFSQGDVGSAEKSGNDSQMLTDDGAVCGVWFTGESAPRYNQCPAGEGVHRDWNHRGYVQNERNVRYLADAVLKGWKVIGGETPPDGPRNSPLPNNYVREVEVPLSGDFPVDYRNAWVPGPVSHPYPSVSNCRSETTATGNPGAPVLGLPDCAREVPGGINDVFGGADDVLAEGGDDAQPFRDALAQVRAAYQGISTAGSEAAAQIYHTMRAEGVPVPDHYDASGFGALEENLRLKLQAFRLGDVVLGSCACEAQVDLILNFESRADAVAGNIYDGFDWACVAEDKGLIPADPDYAAACALQRARHFDVNEFPTHVPGSLADELKVARMRAQVHNDARGWDAPENAVAANSEPAGVTKIWGNFTKEELPADRGYKLAVGIGHAGDYNGYTVSYREYMSHDHYRKALTSYGPHTADYMVTRLVRMAGAMRGAAELAPEPHDAAAQADEARQVAYTQAHGQAVKHAYDVYYAALPPDAGPACTTGDAGCTVANGQPADIGLFDAATFTWRGGSTAADNPRVIVERCAGGAGADCAGGAWTFFGNQTGDVQTRVHWPQGVPGVAMTYGGQQEWLWTANFEAYEGFPARLGGTPAGYYRFVVEGCINDGSPSQENLLSRIQSFLDGNFEAARCRGAASKYVLTSAAFEVFAQSALVESVESDASGNLSIVVSDRSVPQSYASVFPYVLSPDADPDGSGGEARNDDGRFCQRCYFRSWARSDAAPVNVRVQANNRQYVATGSGTSWTAEVGLAPGDTAVVTATYGDGRISLPFTYTRGSALLAPQF